MTQQEALQVEQGKWRIHVIICQHGLEFLSISSFFLMKKKKKGISFVFWPFLVVSSLFLLWKQRKLYRRRPAEAHLVVCGCA